jgi:hypothetical protein
MIRQPRREGAGRTAPLPAKSPSYTRVEHKDFAEDGQARLTDNSERGDEPVPEPTARLTVSALTAALEVLSGTRYLRDFRLYSPEDNRLNQIRAQLSAAILRCRENQLRYARKHRS